MTASNANIGYGAELRFSTDGGTTYVAVAELTSFTPPGVEAGTAEVTHLKSPSRFREHVKTIYDGSEVSFEANWLPAATATDALYAEMARTEASYVQAYVPPSLESGATAKICTFRALFTAWSPGELGADEAMMITGTLKVTGPVEYGDAP